MIDKSVIEQVRAAVDIEQVIGQSITLKSSGGRLWGRCPFHDEKTPSMSVTPSMGLWHCFGCGAGGDTLSYVMKLQGLSFPEAVMWLGEQYGIDVQANDPNVRQQQQHARGLKDVIKLANSFFHQRLVMQGEEARAYLRSRGFEQDTISKYHLGLAPATWRALTDDLDRRGVHARLGLEAGVLARSNSGSVYDRFRGRVMFPITNAMGHVIGFGGRLLDGEGPKYLNTPDTPLYHKSKVLFGLHQALPAIRRTGQVITVEGYTDVMACSQAGMEEAVASCGTALTPEHVSQLKRYSSRIVAMFDQDEAGQAAAEKALPLYLKAGLEVVAPTLPVGTDPATLVEQGQAELLRARINEATPLLTRTMVRISRRYPSSPQGRQRAANAAAELVGMLKGVARSTATAQAARVLAIPHPAFAAQVGKAPAEKRAPSQPSSDPLTAEVIWGLIHARDSVFEHVKQADPIWFDTEDERYIIGRLMDAQPPAEVLNTIENETLRHMYLKISQQPDRHPDPIKVVEQVLVRKELAWIETELRWVEGQDQLPLQRKRLELQRRLRG